MNNDFKGIHLNIEYIRISPTDGPGMISIESSGDQNWYFGDTGSHVGAQIGEVVDGEINEERVIEFGKALSSLIRQHLGKMRPILEK